MEEFLFRIFQEKVLANKFCIAFKTPVILFTYGSQVAENNHELHIFT